MKSRDRLGIGRVAKVLVFCSAIVRDDRYLRPTASSHITAWLAPIGDCKLNGDVLIVSFVCCATDVQTRIVRVLGSAANHLTAWSYKIFGQPAAIVMPCNQPGSYRVL